MRSAEQRWPALWKADGKDVAHRLLGQRRGIDDHGVEAAGLGDQHRVGRGGLGKLPLDQLAPPRSSR